MCDEHGDYTSRHYLTIWTRCPACVAAEVEELEELRRRAAQAARRSAWERALGEAGIPERFQSRTFETYLAESQAQRNALHIAREYAERFIGEARKSGENLIFLGRPGTGKTHLASAIGMHLMRSGSSVLFSTVQRAMRRVRDSWADGARISEAETIALFTTPDLLILDEIGVQGGTEFERNTMFDMLNERYERRRPVLLISNLSPQGVREFLGDRVYDRLREDAGRIVMFGWDSYRPVLGSMARAASNGGEGA